MVQQMFANSNNPQTAADIQWAIWDIFDPGISSNDPYGTISAQDQSNIAGWLPRKRTTPMAIIQIS